MNLYPSKEEAEAFLGLMAFLRPYKIRELRMKALQNGSVETLTINGEILGGKMTIQIIFDETKK